jgi:hypothetical protein
MSILPPATTESRDREQTSRLQHFKAHFFMGVGKKLIGVYFKRYYDFLYKDFIYKNVR